MKFFVVALFLFAVTAAAPASPDAAVEARRMLPALEHEVIQDEFGQFFLRYVTAEGTVGWERGRLVPTANGIGYAMIVEGEVSYIGDDGQTYVTKYNAGLDGTHIEANQFPVSVTAEPITTPESSLSPNQTVTAEPLKRVAERL